jgi:hypothetical protein
LQRPEIRREPEVLGVFAAILGAAGNPNTRPDTRLDVRLDIRVDIRARRTEVRFQQR